MTRWNMEKKVNQIKEKTEISMGEWKAGVSAKQELWR